LIAVAHALRGEGFDASEDGTGRGTPIVPVAQPLTLMERGRNGEPNLEYRQDGTANAILTPSGGRGGLGVGAIAFAENSRAEIRLCGGDGQVMSQLTTSGGKPGQGQPVISKPWAVRRLTPRECERLMGFPDDFTCIPWRGKPPEACPDGPRYKALGNSWAVNCAEWVGERIATVDEMTEVRRTA
jgi:DNA (cytosine-5)-methyltransferase 1